MVCYIYFVLFSYFNLIYNVTLKTSSIHRVALTLRHFSLLENF